MRLAAWHRPGVTDDRGRTTEQVQALYTRRKRSYIAYVQAFGHRQGIRSVLDTSALLGPNQRILDAGCVNGLSLMAVAEALRRRGYHYRALHGFDLTPAMLERCRQTLRREGIEPVELRQADVTRLDEELPDDGSGYHLVVCTSMLEYVGPAHLTQGLEALRCRLGKEGHLLVIVTRKAFFPTRPIWQCHRYTRGQLQNAFTMAGYRQATFRHYPLRFGWLNVAEHVIDACGP